MDKTEIRNRYIELRADMPERDIRANAARIIDRLLTSVEWSSVRSLHLYQSVDAWHEVPTTEISGMITARWPNIAVTIGQVERTAPILANRYDVIIVPVLAFDDSLHRLGFGGGWYDRFLDLQTDALKIGLAYDLQQHSHLPAEPHDIRLDRIITESRVLTR